MAGGIFGEGSASGAVDVGAFLDSGVTKQIADLVSMGCLVSIGGSRDGGAVSINVLYEGDTTRQWFRDVETATDWLEGVRGVLVAAGAVLRAAQAVPVRKRRRGPLKDF